MTTLGGLPAHVLLVHAVVVLVPLSALLLVLVSVWPAARRRLTWFTAVLCVLTLVAVPVTTDAGEWLEHRVPSTPLIRTHTALGDTMLPWAIGLAVLGVVVLGRYLLARRAARNPDAVDPAGTGVPTGTGATGAPGAATTAGPGGRTVSVLIGVLAVVVAVGSVVTVYRIGESGARAVWTGQFSAAPISGPPIR